jgi:hypothetical protein
VISDWPAAITRVQGLEGVEKGKLGHSEELAALKRLDDQARQLEYHLTGPSFDALIAEEHAGSHIYGGRSVLGEAKAPGQPLLEASPPIMLTTIGEVPPMLVVCRHRQRRRT